MNRFLSILVPLFLLVCGLVAGPASAVADPAPVRLGTTTTVENSGLLRHLLPAFTAAAGRRVRSVVQGTGQILRSAASGNVAVLITHDRKAEDKFVAAGQGSKRRNLMYSHFTIVGPGNDPARVRAASSLVDALKRIAAAKARFVSRGDDSGTHRFERGLWRQAGLTLRPAGARWYMESGAGMGATLNIAAGRDAYALTETATWLAHGNKGRLVELIARRHRSPNQYGVILVTPSRLRPGEADAARAFFDWVTSPAGQARIATYTIAGNRPFTPNAR